jgi:hypothetical protein
LKDNSFDKSGFKWSRFAGLASQWAVALVILLFSGKYLDGLHFIKLKFPLFIWLLPFIFILFSLFSIVKETGRNTKTDHNK